MYKRILLIFVVFIAITLNSCSRKIHPSREATIIPVSGISSETTTKTVVKRTPKPVFPKMITVNDSAAHKSIDGRYYYDVMGHRYWRNNKDGKYYLFNKSMYNNDAFKKP